TVERRAVLIRWALLPGDGHGVLAPAGPATAHPDLGWRPLAGQAAVPARGALRRRLPDLRGDRTRRPTVPRTAQRGGGVRPRAASLGRGAVRRGGGGTVRRSCPGGRSRVWRRGAHVVDREAGVV